MFLHSTTDTGVQIRRTVLGRYTLHLDGAPIGSVLGDYKIGFIATDKDGTDLGRHESLHDAAAVVHANLVTRVERNARLQRDEESVWSVLHADAPVQA
jgi:hypothetical protein